MEVTAGRIVHYVLSEQDAEAINRRRVTGSGRGKHRVPVGVQAHVGNPAHEGDVVPAIVVWADNNEAGTFTGQAFLDGNDTLWITSVPFDVEGARGSWHWPPVAEVTPVTGDSVTAAG